MSDEEFELEEEQPATKQQIDERKRHIKEQIELRKIARELGLSFEDYLEAFGD